MARPPLSGPQTFHREWKCGLPNNFFYQARVYALAMAILLDVLDFSGSIATPTLRMCSRNNLIWPYQVLLG